MLGVDRAVAATSGESATVVTHLMDCLNTIYDDTPDDVCHPNQDVRTSYVYYSIGQD
jgi:hypothetical protein